MSEKQSINELAIFGGTPAFSEKLHVGRPNVGDQKRVMALINDLLERRMLTNTGPFVQEFEKKIEAMVGVKHCIAMCNATVALEIAIRAVGFTGEVIVPSFTFIATAHALQWQQITPVFCDIDPATHCIDPKRVEELITPRTTGIIGVHLWGRSAAINELTEIAQKHNLGLIFDAAHAFGCSYNGKMIGNFGDAEVLSFHATKFFNTFEGGAVLTNNDDLAAKIRLMKNFGFAGTDKVIYIGTNGKMNEVSAAMGIASLESIDEFISTNRRNYESYKENIAKIPGISMIDYNDSEKRNYQYIVFEIDESISRISRDSLVSILQAENVIARRYFYPGCHRMEPYRSYFPYARLMLSETENITERVMQLPTGTAIGHEEICKVCNIIKVAIDNGPEITQRMGVVTG